MRVRTVNGRIIKLQLFKFAYTHVKLLEQMQIEVESLPIPAQDEETKAYFLISVGMLNLDPKELWMLNALAA
jgi:hypothetical protein